MWEECVKMISGGWRWGVYTSESVMKHYHYANKRLTNLTKRLDNPVSLKGGGPLKPTTIRQLKKEKEKLIQDVAFWKKFIKILVKKNLLPTNKLISGEDRMQFAFSLWTMLELPELGKAVYYANRLTGCRYDHITTATNNGYAQKIAEGVYLRAEKEEERSRESMCDALINSLNEALARIMKERQRLLFSGSPLKQQTDTADAWKPALTAIHGGLYTPPPVKIVDDQLTDKFRAFLEKERSQEVTE
ncbi:MAG: hypothetical protein WCJ37_02515 [Syntrophus sp. (in: bacteria)]